MPRGGARPGAGRPRKIKVLGAEEGAALPTRQKQKPGELPLDYMLRISATPLSMTRGETRWRRWPRRFVIPELPIIGLGSEMRPSRRRSAPPRGLSGPRIWCRLNNGP
jgi:hypothetical protein